MTARDGKGSVAARLRGLERRLGILLQPGCPDCRGGFGLKVVLLDHGEPLPPLDETCPRCGRAFRENEGLGMVLEEDVPVALESAAR